MKKVLTIEEVKKMSWKELEKHHSEEINSSRVRNDKVECSSCYQLVTPKMGFFNVWKCSACGAKIYDNKFPY